VKANDPRDVPAASRELESHCPAEAEADCGYPIRIDFGALLERIQTSLRPGTNAGHLAPERSDQTDHLLHIVDDPAITVQIAGECYVP
jgi:hypothetical protein